MRVLDAATHARIASFTASFSVALPDSTGTTSAPSSFMRQTLSAWRSTSTAPMYTVQPSPNSAAAVAVATPCWPAPVSAISVRLAHAPREQRLAEHVVDLVRPGVREVLALQEHAHAESVGEALALGDRCRPAGVARQQGRVLLAEPVVDPRVAELAFELLERGHQRLGRVAAAVLAEATETDRFGAGRCELDRCATRRSRHPAHDTALTPQPCASCAPGRTTQVDAFVTRRPASPTDE